MTRYAGIFGVCALAVALAVTGSAGGSNSGSGGGSGQAAGGAKSPLVLGVLAPMTVAATWGGQTLTQGTQLAAQEINKSGGILGHPLKVVIEDNQCDPVVTTSAMQKIMLLKPVATLGGFCSSATLAALAISARVKVPHFAVSETSPAITSGSNHYVVHVIPTAPQLAQVYSQYLTTKRIPQVKSVFVVYEETDTGVAEVAAFRQAMSARGVTIQSVGVERSLSDFNNIVSRVISAHPDFVELSLTDGQIIQFVQAAAAQKLNTANTGTMLWASPNLFSQVGDLMNKFLYIQMYFPGRYRTAATLKFEKAYAAKYPGQTPFWTVATSYDAVYLLKAAAEKAHSVNPQAINKALHGYRNFVGASGKFSIDSKGQSSFSLSRLVLTQWDAANKKPVLIPAG